MHIHTLGEIDSRLLWLSTRWKLSKSLARRAKLENELLQLWDLRDALEPWTGRVSIPSGIILPDKLNGHLC